MISLAVMAISALSFACVVLLGCLRRFRDANRMLKKSFEIVKSHNAMLIEVGDEMAALLNKLQHGEDDGE